MLGRWFRVSRNAPTASRLRVNDTLRNSFRWAEHTGNQKMDNGPADGFGVLGSERQGALANEKDHNMQRASAKTFACDLHKFSQMLF